MALLDMGAEFKFYGSDITCSFPVSIWLQHIVNNLYLSNRLIDMLTAY